MRPRGPYIDRALIVRVPATREYKDALLSGATVSYRIPPVFMVDCGLSYQPQSISQPIHPATVIAHDGIDYVTLRVHLPLLL